MRGGVDKLYLDSDIARDLSEISKLWIGQKVLWLGPRYSVGLHSSPFYYYLFSLPIFLSGGKAGSIVIFNVILAIMALGFLGFAAYKKLGTKGLFVPLTLGMMPWWQDIAIHPGNGSTYAIFMLVFLTLLWFKLPVFLTVLFLGISASMHPGAFFGLPLIVYEFVKQKKSFKTWFISMFVFLIPFLPLIIFQLMTRGYWLSNWLTEQGRSFNLILGFININSFISFSGVYAGVFLVLLVLLVTTTNNRQKVWLILSLLSLSVFTFFSKVPVHYLFGIMSMVWFCTSAFLMENNKRIVIPIILVFLVIDTLFLRDSPKVSARPISKIEGVVDYLIQNDEVLKNDRLAVLAQKDCDTKTPQADDYRFFLRVKGYKVEEVSDYSKADKLIIFVEDKKLDWQNWCTWETEQFGHRKLIKKMEVNGILITIYTR